MNALAQRLAGLIAAQGPLSIAQFMAQALMDPDHGYYATRDPFGANGDFITAPEISQMFGELIGLWLVQVWRDQDCPPARLIELGPGRGTLMADALRAAARVAPEFAAQADIVLVEASATLRGVQEKTLAAAGLRASWQASFDEGSDARALFVIANEFFDCLPIRQFQFDGEAWRERMIGLDANGALGFALAPVYAKALAPPGSRGIPQLGDIFEICPPGIALAEHLGQAVAERGGAALLIDYGYGHEAGFGETLQAVKAHAPVPVLEAPGEADITAHVDFIALSEAAKRGGGPVFGALAQGLFLERLGLAERVAALSKANPALADSLAGDAERLRAPKQMGELFKALALMPAHVPPPPGF